MWCYILCASLFLLARAQNTPHIIFILADDLGWNDVGFHGSNQIPTPNIDALAYSGVILNNYYVMPICTPSRSALLTGRHPIHTGMQHRVIVANEPWGLSLTEKLLPEYLKEKGYTTHIVGKWHLGHFSANYTPTYRGFDSHYGYWTGHQDYYDHTAEDQPRYWGYDMRANMDVHWKSYGHYTTDLFTDKAVQLVQDHNASLPLFLYLAHLATHSANPYLPLQAPADVVTRFRHIRDEPRRIFAGMVTKLDQSVGAVVSALGAKGMINNSIIIFSTDNGGPAAGFDENAASNWPLRGVKDTQWEGGVRGVGLIWSPLIASAPRVATHLMHIQDWLPTLLRAVNSSTASVKVDGQDMWDIIRHGDDGKPYDELLVNIDNDRAIAALRKGDWKLILGNVKNGEWDGWYGPSGRDAGEHYNLTLVTKSPAARAVAATSAPLPADKQTLLKLRKDANVVCKTPRELSSPALACVRQACLFDLRSDPCELNDQALKKPDKVTELLTILRRYNETVVPARNKPADPRSNPKFWGYTWTTWMDMVKKTL